LFPLCPLVSRIQVGEPPITRYDGRDSEWAVIYTMLPNEPCGVPVWMTGAFSTGSLGSCDQEPGGAICGKAMDHVQLAIIGLFAGVWDRIGPRLRRRGRVPRQAIH
jgi:hypothetical protein